MYICDLFQYGGIMLDLIVKYVVEPILTQNKRGNNALL